MLFRFAVIVTVLELLLTTLASVLVTYTEPPPGFATEADLRSLGLTCSDHSNRRWLRMNAPCYDTRAQLESPSAVLEVSLRTDATATDYDFRRAANEAIQRNPDRGEVVVLTEPFPGERGYAVRHRGPKSVRFELARLRGTELFIVSVVRERPFDTLEAAELSKCERRARAVQEHLMFKMRWRD